MNGNGQTEEGAIKEAWLDEWHNLPEAEKAKIRSLIKALDKNRMQAQVINAQEAKIAEQAALLEQRQTMLDRYAEALKLQAFRLGTQDRELLQLRASNNGLEAALRRSEAKVAELQAGDLALMRSVLNFQHAEITRLKAAAAKVEADNKYLRMGLALKQAGEAMMAAIANMGPALMQGTATAIVEEAEDATDDQRFVWEAERATLEAKIAELESERDAARRKLALKANAMLAGQKRIAELETAITDLRDELTIKTHYAAGLLDSVKALNDDLAEKKATIERQAAVWDGDQKTIRALQNDVERLKGIADYSNNLAFARLEELAKLRKELVVAREATAKLEARLAEFD